MEAKKKLPRRREGTKVSKEPELNIIP